MINPTLFTHPQNLLDSIFVIPQYEQLEREIREGKLSTLRILWNSMARNLEPTYKP